MSRIKIRGAIVFMLWCLVALSQGINIINLELGLDVDFEDVHYQSICTYADKIDRFDNQEFNSVYLYPSIYSLSDFNLQTDEASGIIKLNVQEGMRLFNGEVEEITTIRLRYRQWGSPDQELTHFCFGFRASKK